MKLIIFGSRNAFPSIAEIDYALEISGLGGPVTEVVCGLAPGGDECGRVWAKHHKIPVAEFPAAWGLHGKRAGHIRNLAMAKYGDAGLGFWKNESGGTANMTAHLVSLKKPVVLIRVRTLGELTTPEYRSR